MSMSYRFTVKRPVDGKIIASFYYDRIKSLGEVYLKDRELVLDPERISGNSGFPSKFRLSDIERDIDVLKCEKAVLASSASEKKLLAVMAAKAEVKQSLDEDLDLIAEQTKYIEYAIEALAGLEAVVEAVTENMVRPCDSEDEKAMAYMYNAEGLPEDRRCVWAKDVEIEALAG